PIYGMITGRYDLRGYTRNINVGRLLSDYHNAQNIVRGKRITQDQMNIYLNTTISDERRMKSDFSPIIKSIEFGLNKAQLENKHVDLEDACTIARVGLQ
ncbi:unnamed protein product, partial [marine sediment metagenome]